MWILFGLSCSRQDKHILNESETGIIDGKILTQEDLFAWIPETQFKSLADSIQADTVSAFFLMNLVKKEVESEGLQKDKGLLRNLRSWESERLSSILYKKEILPKILNEENLRKLYVDVQQEKEISIILIQFQNTAEDKIRPTEEEAKKLANLIYEKTNTSSFEELARKYSDDSKSKSSGGYLGWIRRYQFNPAIDSIAWSIPVGKVSLPFMAEEGCCLLKVNSERKGSWTGFESDLPVLTDIANNLWQDKFKQYDLKYSDSLKQMYKLKLDSTGIAKFVSEYEKMSQQADVPPVKVIERIQTPVNLGTYAGIRMDKEWLLDRISELNILNTNMLLIPARFTGLIENKIVVELITQRARDLGYDQEAGYQKILNQYKLTLYYKFYLDQRLYPSVEPSAAEIESYYEQHKLARYMTEEQVVVQVIELSSQALARQVYDQCKAGKLYPSLVRRYHERQLLRKEDGIFTFTRNEWGSLSQTAFNLKIGEIGSPISYRNKFLIVKVLERIPPAPKFLSEVKDQIKNELWKVRKHEATEKLYIDLSKKYNARFNDRFVYHYQNRIKSI